MGSELIEIAKVLGTDLSSRTCAAKLREQIQTHVDLLDHLMILDFTGVRSMSHSAADELFAVLVEKNGENWFRQNLQLDNLRPRVRESILEAVHIRLERPMGGPLDAWQGKA